MSELRVDPLTGLRVLLAPGAETGAPGGTTAGAPAFVPGVPALRPDAETPPREASLDLFTSAAARGHHELLAWAPGGPLSALTAEELSVAMGTWRERMAAHAEAAHVHLHVDRDTTAAELHAFDFVPAAVARERERASAYATRTQGSDLLGDLVQAEVRQRARLVAYDDEAVLLAPYASRVPFQLMVVPHAGGALRGAGPSRRGRAAPRPAGPLRPLRRPAAAGAVGAHGAARRGALLLEDRRASAPRRPGRARARDGRAGERGHARAGDRGAAHTPLRDALARAPAPRRWQPTRWRSTRPTADISA